jgi:hypothetical protein
MAPPGPEPLIEMPELAGSAILTLLRLSGPAVCLMLFALCPFLQALCPKLCSLFRFPDYEDMSLKVLAFNI